jgi:hypothetical protein
MHLKVEVTHKPSPQMWWRHSDGCFNYKAMQVDENEYLDVDLDNADEVAVLKEWCDNACSKNWQHIKI